jgi:hypothetical protein
MSSFDKLIQKIFEGRNISYADAERVLFSLEFDLDIRASHHIFRKRNCKKIVLKKRSQLLDYQIKDLKEVLLNHGYTKENNKKRS